MLNFAQGLRPFIFYNLDIWIIVKPSPLFSALAQTTRLDTFRLLVKNFSTYALATI